MATSLQLYKKSTFPPLLNIYQLPHSRNQNDKIPKKMMTKDDNRKKRSNKSSFSDEDKEDAIKRALLEQHHLENYKNLYRLRNAMYVRYRDLLNKKVQKQRIQIRMSDLNFKQNLEQQGREKIVGLQNELTRQGILKNKQDYEDFWTLILESTHGSRHKEKLQDIKLKMAAAKSFPSHPVVRTSAAQSANVLLSNRCGQLKMSSTSLPGSVSCQPPVHHPSKHRKAKEETEQFPKSKPCKRTRKHFHHERRLIYLHHMYHLALLNMTSSKRLLEKNGQFAVAEKEHSVHDLMEYLFPSHQKQPGNSTTERGIEESTFPILLDRKQQGQCHRGFSKAHTIFKEMKNHSKEKHENKGAVEMLEDQKYNNSAFAPHEMIPVPLTVEDVVLNNPVVACIFIYSFVPTIRKLSQLPTGLIMWTKKNPFSKEEKDD